jgi:exosome complex component RRP46
MQNLSIIPALLHASILGLLTGAVPLKNIATAVTVAITEDEDIVVEPSTTVADHAKSVHALGFTSKDELLLVESKGHFTLEEWERVLETGQRVCCQSPQEEQAVQTPSIRRFIRSAMQTKTADDLHWRGGA